MPPQGFDAVNSLYRRYSQALSAVHRRDDVWLLLPLICDLKVENGEFTWDNDLPPGGEVNFVRSPIGFHDADCDRLPRQLDSFSGTLARRKLQWRAAEGHSGRAMHAGQARTSGRSGAAASACTNIARALVRSLRLR
jgi:hypothetical protein